jgi:hypothetical protein
MRILLVALAAAALAAFTYLRLEGIGRRGWPALVCRALAWTAIGLLVLNVSCPVSSTALRPLVLLDGSLSMVGAGGRWAEARDSSARWGEVRRFGDERGGADTTPDRGRSLLGPALLAASSSDRPLLVVTDGEIEDAPDLPRDLIARTGIRLFPRTKRSDLAITRVTGPSRVTAGDSIRLEIDLEFQGDSAPDTASVRILTGRTKILTRRLKLANGRVRSMVLIPSAQVGPGDHLLEVSLAGWKDDEARTDTRLHYVSVAPSPGVVLLAVPGDWDSRFLYRALRDVAQLPVRGFVRLDAEHWRSMSDLSAVPAERVRQAARRADLLVLKGGAAAFAEGTTARGILSWPAPVAEDAELPGDWYLSADPGSPLAGAFLGQPVDSFPPAVELMPVEPGAGDWVALTAQLGRRGPPRPAIVGRQEGRTRRVVFAVDGLWRWAFRGGSSEESYRSLVAATASWLLAGADSVRGVARLARPVVENGRPLVFEWAGPGTPEPTAIAWTGDGAPAPDTLRFDGSGHALVWLRPGAYRYRLSGGGAGTAAVESYSEEFLSRPVVLTARDPTAPIAAGRRSAREWPWLFALCILALAGEWLARRRLGLR